MDRVDDGIFLSDDEIKMVVMAVLDGNGVSTEKDFEKALQWANQARADGALLSLVMTGQTSIFFENGEIGFKDAKFA